MSGGRIACSRAAKPAIPLGHSVRFSRISPVAGSRASQPLHTTFTVSYPALAMPEETRASAISPMLLSFTRFSQVKRPHECHCIGGYGATCAAGSRRAAGASGVRAGGGSAVEAEAPGAPAASSAKPRAAARRECIVVALLGEQGHHERADLEVGSE